VSLKAPFSARAAWAGLGVKSVNHMLLVLRWPSALSGSNHCFRDSEQPSPPLPLLPSPLPFSVSLGWGTTRKISV
jgi:hypothetical protein